MSQKTMLKLLPVVFLLIVGLFVCRTHYARPLVEVTKSSQKDRIPLPSRATCATSTDKDACLTKLYETYARAAGVEKALLAIRSEIILDAAFGGMCHDIMHHVGHVAATEYKTVREAYLHGNYDCGNGYFHGVVEEVVGEMEGAPLTPSGLRHFCDAISSTSTPRAEFATMNCVHGLGHALVHTYKGNLAPALQSCMNMVDDAHKSECMTGAFMENMIERLPFPAQSDPQQNPSLTCASALGDAYRCWVGLSAFVISEESSSTTATLDFCFGFASTTYRSACGEGLGRAAAIGRIPLVSSTSYCKVHAGALASDCIRGALRFTQTSPDTEDPFYSTALKKMRWATATGADPLIGSIRVLAD